MARIAERGLRPSVGVPGLFATAYGNVGSSIYYALGLVALHALGLTPVVFMLAGGLFALTAKTYAEGASMYPEAGGSSSFARHAFNEIASFFAGWALTLDYVITIAISAFFVPHYLGAFWPALNHNPGDIIGGAVVVGVLALLNIRGVGGAAKLNLVLAVIDLVTQVVLVVVGVYAGISVVALSTLPVHEHAGTFSTALGTTYENDPVLGIVNQLGLGTGLEHGLRAYVGVLAATILLIATNAGLIGVSRLSWSLSEHRQLPGLFARLHSRYRTPWFTIAVFSVLAVLLLLPGQTDFLGNLYSFGAMLSFTIAHIAVVALRYRQPDRPRPYRAPWNVRVRGREIPLTAVVGAVGTAAAFASVLVLHTEARTVGLAWMAAGMAGYVLYRRHQGLDPRTTYKIEREQRPPDFAALGYKTAIVPIFGTDLNARALRRAAKLLGSHAVVYALYVL